MRREARGVGGGTAQFNTFKTSKEIQFHAMTRIVKFTNVTYWDLFLGLICCFAGSDYAPGEHIYKLLPP